MPLLCSNTRTASALKGRSDWLYSILLAGRFDAFLMSCRVIGRKVEDRIIARAAELLPRHTAQLRWLANIIPTRNNGLVSSFYEDHGFSLVAEEDGWPQAI